MRLLFFAFLGPRRVATSPCLLLGAACAAFLPGCADGGEPGNTTVTCRRIAQLGGRSRPALLTGDPFFSLSEVAAGRSLTLSIPVNENTRSVSVSVRSEDQEVGASVSSRDTVGDETVILLVNTAGLPTGIYFLRVATLEGGSTEERSSYATSNPSGPYRLIVTQAPERTFQCFTDIPVPSFTLVDSNP